MNENQEMRVEGRIENLENQLRKLSALSRENDFSIYLSQMATRLQTPKYQVDLMQEDLRRNYLVYVNRMRRNGVSVPETLEAAMEQGMQAVHVEQASGQTIEQSEGVPERPVQTIEQSEGVSEPPVQTIEQREVASESPVQTIEQREGVSERPVQAMGQSEPEQAVEQAEQVTDSAEQSGQVIDRPEPTEKPPVSRPTAGKNMEFVVGGTILSVVGTAFILVALVALGMNYMNNFVKGMCPYIICGFLLLMSELWVYRKLPKLSCVLTAVSISGLYLTTAVNYLSWRNFSLWVTLGITMALTLGMVVLSRKRESLFYRVIVMIAAYLSFLMMQKGTTDAEFYIITGLILLLNIVCLMVPIRKYGTVTNIIHMIINVLFATGFMIRADYCGISELAVFLYFVSSTLVMNLILALQLTGCPKEGNESGEGILTAYSVSALLSVGWAINFCEDFICHPGSFFGGLPWKMQENDFVIMSVMAAALGGIAIVTFAVLCAKRCSGKWFVYYYLNLLIYAIYMHTDNEIILYSVMLITLTISKILLVRNIKEVRVSDAVISIFVCLNIIFEKNPSVLLAGIVVSILALSQWKTFHEILITFTLVIYAVQNVPSLLKLPVAVGIMFVGILVFHNVKRWKDKNIQVYNILNLLGQTVCFVMLGAPVYRNAYLTYFFMLIFGVATIVLTLREQYGMKIRGRSLIMACFLTYMALIIKTNVPVVNSILLMIIAVAGVGVGFFKRQKALRIYGLALSLLVCGKLVIYDFLGIATLQKMILFLAVGIIALIIAAIYIILEKKINGQGEAYNEEAK